MQENQKQIMFISKTLIFLHFEKEGEATGVVFFFLILDDERDILLAEHSRTTVFSTNQSENQNQT